MNEGIETRSISMLSNTLGNQKIKSKINNKNIEDMKALRYKDLELISSCSSF